MLDPMRPKMRIALRVKPCKEFRCASSLYTLLPLGFEDGFGVILAGHRNSFSS
jgi:hypothetical protein